MSSDSQPKLMVEQAGVGVVQWHYISWFILLLRVYLIHFDSSSRV